MNKSLIFFLLLLSTLTLTANNIRIENARLASQDTAQDFYMIEFDLSWDNSWRTSTFESNWDAAWVFAKFRVRGELAFRHCALSNLGGHTVPAGAAYTIGTNSASLLRPAQGLFIYRDSDGFGDVNFQGVQMRWQYDLNSLGDDEIVEIAVYGIEMVYVPQASFYVGDGTNSCMEVGTSGNPYPVTSESTITLGGLGTTALNTFDNLQDDFNYSTTQTLPSSFPKGYDAFYCMKYEVSQQQYTDFLLSLDPNDMDLRIGPCTDVVGAPPTTPTPIFINNNFPAASVNASRPWAAMDCLSWLDIMAYLDWSALRPLSEMEFEKACRGTLEPVALERAWGNPTFARVSVLTDSGKFILSGEGPNEIIVEGIFENQGNGCGRLDMPLSQRTVRCGIFAASAINKTRQETGASYYGLMELTANVTEPIIGIGSASSRVFSGLHGDGFLDANADASASVRRNWGGLNGGRGIVWRDLTVSYRYFNAYGISAQSTRLEFIGIRGCRTAP
jgi:hypothetical protein